MRGADGTDDGARPGDCERGVHRLAGTDALEGGLDAETVGHLADRFDRGVAALGDDVGRTELAGDRLSRRVPG